MTIKRIRLALIGMWIVTLSTFILPIFFSENYEYYLYRDPEFMCSCQIRYLWFWLLTYPYIPGLGVSVMAFSTFHIIRKLRENKKLSEDVGQQKAKMERNNKAAKLIMISAMAFSFAFVPFVSIVFVDFVSNHSVYHPPIVDFLVMWSANANSFINVIIFLCIYSSFRRNAKMLLIRFFCCNSNYEISTEKIDKVKNVSKSISSTVE